MMHRSQNLLVSGDQEYFNEKRPVNVRVDGTAHRAEIFLRPGNNEPAPRKHVCAPGGAGSLIALEYGSGFGCRRALRGHLLHELAHGGHMTR
jgi:hypothetical protein